MKIFIVLQFVLLHLICSEVNGFSKNWMWSTKWADARNWDKNRLPCSNDQIILAEGVIYLDKNATFSNLELPNGELVLNDNTEVTIKETPKAGSGSKDCPGEPVRFTGNTPRDWFNPLNWNFMENGSVPAWNDGSLYLDRIPCNNDNVFFPEANAFVVSLGSNANVGELFLGKQSYSNAQLTTYLASSQGKMSFKRTGNSKVTVTQKTCQQSVGCPCGYSKMKKMICSKFVCPPSCKNKVTPEGDCCERCGAIVKMDIAPEFNLNSCQNILRSRLSQTKATLFISPIEVNNAIEKVQILITDKADGKDATSAAQETANYLSEGAKAKVCSSFNVKVITSKSGGGDGGTGKTKRGKDDSNTSTVALAVTLSIVLVILALAGFYLFYRRRNRGGNANLQVLHNEMDISGSRNIEMRDTEFIKDVLDFDSDYGKGASSFENPMYDDMMDLGPAVIEPKTDSEYLEPVYAKPIRKSNDEDQPRESKSKKKKDKKSSKTKSSTANGKATMKKSESSDAFDNPVYGHVQYTPDFDDSTEPAFDQPMPGDSGYSNPLYGDLHPVGDQQHLDNAMATEPPSFLDVIGFSPDDMDTSIPEDPSKIKVEIVGEIDESKGESEA